MIKERIDAGIDEFVTKTQFGFRKAKSTAQAIFLARIILDLAEKQGSNLTFILLDWEKAFDKIDHNRMLEALARLNIPLELQSLISVIYEAPQFKVVSGGKHSEYLTQHSGIRQGCPLPQYLFILVTTTINNVRYDRNSRCVELYYVSSSS